MGPDGTLHEFPDDTKPEEILNFFKDAPPTKSDGFWAEQAQGAERGVQGLAQGVNQTLAPLVDPQMGLKVGNSVLDASSSHFKQAQEEYKAGNHATALKHLMASIPILGQMIQGTADTLTSGKPGAVTEGVVGALPALLAGGREVTLSPELQALEASTEKMPSAIAAATKAGGKDLGIGASKMAGGLGVVGLDSMSGMPLEVKAAAGAALGGWPIYRGGRQVIQGLDKGNAAFWEALKKPDLSPELQSVKNLLDNAQEFKLNPNIARKLNAGSGGGIERQLYGGAGAPRLKAGKFANASAKEMLDDIAATANPKYNAKAVDLGYKDFASAPKDAQDLIKTVVEGTGYKPGGWNKPR